MAIYFSLLIAIFMCLIIPFGSSLSFNYTSFSASNDDNVTYEGAFLDSNRIQLASSKGTVGRATYNKPMRLWDWATRNLTDFSTHFIFEIDSQNRSAYADGLAFFLAPQGSRIPNITKEGSFGLSTNDNQAVSGPSNSFVAVEFDIFKNTWDPPGEHVGIDINSVISVSNLTWWTDIMDGQKSEAWINYNSSTQNLSVVFTGIRDKVTVMQHLDYKVDLRLFLPEFVTVGFSAATGNHSAIHSLYSWEFSSSLEVEGGSTGQAPPPSNRRRRRRRKRGVSKKTRLGLGLGLGLGGGGVVVCLLVLVWFIDFVRGRKRGDEEDNNGVDEKTEDKFQRGSKGGDEETQAFQKAANSSA